MSNNAFKVFAINGSHRAQNGITEIVMRRFMEGVQEAGADCEVSYPSKMKIAPCIGCYKCIIETPGICRHNDDMQFIIDMMETADLLVLASPVYCDTMTSTMKKVFERLMPTYGPVFEFRNGRTYHVRNNKGKTRAIAISISGDPEMESFASISKTFKRIITQMEGYLLGEFYFSASHLIITQPECVTSQLEAVRNAGKEIVVEGRIREETIVKANREYVDDPESVVKQITQVLLKKRKRYGNV